MLHINEEISISRSELNFSFARSPGPGGQNVNKVNSKAVLRWSLADTQAISPAVKYRIRLHHANRITNEDELVISSHRYRDQPRNVDDCLNKLKLIVQLAAVPPVPRKKTKVPKGVVRRRLENKKRTSEKKKLRSRVDRHD